MRILFAGRGVLGHLVLEALLGSSHEVVGVLHCARRPPRTHGFAKAAALRLLRLRDPRRAFDPVRLAATRGVPAYSLDRMAQEELEPLRSLKPDLIVLGSFPLIFRKELLELPRLGCLNTHPSLLPRFRGPNPYTRVILARERESGVTFHRMEPGIDTGNVLERVSFPVAPDETFLSLQRKSAEAAAAQLPALLERVATHGLHGKPQSTEGASYQGPVTEEELFMPWHKTLQEIEPMFRAFEPYVYPRFRHGDRVVRVVSARFAPERLTCAPGTLVSSKKRVAVAAADGCVVIRFAYTTGIVPRPWPHLWSLGR